MHIKRLVLGERAPDGWDYIRIERTASGFFDVTGAIASSGGATCSRLRFPTEKEAEAAGIDWAAQCESKIVYLETIAH